MERILITLPLEEGEGAAFSALAPQAELRFSTPETVGESDVLWATAILGGVPEAYVRRADRLAWLHLPSAGPDRFLAPGVLPSQVTLTSSVGAYGQAVSEHSFASLLAVMKKLTLYRDDQCARAWRDEGPVTTLAGARVLVLGAGDLGLHFATLCHAVGATCLAVRRHLPGTGEEGDAYRAAFVATHLMEDLPGLLPTADVVACFLPSTPQTRGLADAAFFDAMRPGSYFVNAGRGDLVVQDALCVALESGRLAGAALDVTTPEPLPADSRLWGQRNLLLTPHGGGFWHLPVTRRNVVRIAQDNLSRYLSGAPLRNVQRAPLVSDRE